MARRQPRAQSRIHSQDDERLGGGWHRVDRVLVPKDRSATAKICSELKPLEDGRAATTSSVSSQPRCEAEPDDDEVEFSHVRTADERNAEETANAEFVG